MPTAKLLLREPAVTSLTSLVEKSQHRKPPFPEYDLRLNSCQLDFVPISCVKTPKFSPSSDEGFESDLDTVSLVSTDDSVSLRDNGNNRETDSANGSSDSDTEAPPPISNPDNSESYHLVDCICYTDIKFPNILLFIVKGDALVFRFDNLENLKKFHTNFSTFKAIANQKVYGKNLGAKFNLLQRTDKNGITHIEITKEPEAKLSFPQEEKSGGIISLNTPESHYFLGNASSAKESSFKQANYRQQSESPRAKNSHTSKVSSYQRSASIENILQSPTANFRTIENNKWNSAEDLLDSAPKRPERRRKAKAPQPPLDRDVFQGQFVRVNVAPNKPPFPMTREHLLLSPVKKPESSWSYSMPRFLKKPRSQSETRNFTPMAYRYIDTTQQNFHYGRPELSSSVSNRLFGMSSKLKDFSEVDGGGTLRRYEQWDSNRNERRGSLGELSYKIGGGSLKSVIKKDDNKRRSNEKKVTFSAYTTVQVV